MNENLILKAQLYAARRKLEIAEQLGSGKDGIVFVARRKIASAKVAIKVHRYEENYIREKREQFEERWSIVQKILDSFEEIGMYLMDVSPANIAFSD